MFTKCVDSAHETCYCLYVLTESEHHKEGESEMIRKTTTRAYFTDNSHYRYIVQEHEDEKGKLTFTMIIPQPVDKIRKVNGKWANSRIIAECVEDFGLTAERHTYNPDGTVEVFGR